MAAQREPDSSIVGHDVLSFGGLGQRGPDFIERAAGEYGGQPLDAGDVPHRCVTMAGQRRELLGSRLMGVYGKVEREGIVVHLVAGRLVDLTPMLGMLPTRSRDFR